MNRSATSRLLASLAFGVASTAILMLVWGVSLSLAWPEIYQAPWPSIGNNAGESLLRARLFDGLFGIVGGVICAFALRLAGKVEARSVVVFTAGAFVYVMWSQGENLNVMQLRHVLETPAPTFLVSFSVVSYLLRSWARRAENAR